MYIYIDIETIPSQRNESRPYAARGIKPPGNISKAETIAKWNEEKRPGLEEQAWQRTALNGAWGELCCICWAAQDSDISAHTRPTIEDDEAVLLSGFFGQMESVRENAKGRPITWVGHNVSGFDLRFLWQRAVILGVRPPINLRQDATPWSDMIIDTMQMWAGNRGSISLVELCDALRIDDGADDITGADVWRTYQAGRFDVVLEHCMLDVARTRLVHQAMMFRGF